MRVLSAATRAARKPRSPLHLECGRDSHNGGEEGASLLVPAGQDGLSELRRHHHQQEPSSGLVRPLCTLFAVGLVAVVVLSVSTTLGRGASPPSSSQRASSSPSSSAWLPPLESIRLSASSCPQVGTCWSTRPAQSALIGNGLASQPRHEPLIRTPSRRYVSPLP